MPRQKDVRRLFQADGYTFVRWIKQCEVETQLSTKAIEACFDLRTDRALGFKLVSRQAENTSSSTSLLPFSRPTRTDDKFRYEIPHAGDCRSRCAARYGWRTKRMVGVGSKTVLITRTRTVSSRKIDLTAANYFAPAGVLGNLIGQSPSAISV
jgi:hypothetical protein